jgi:hypothetical protein
LEGADQEEPVFETINIPYLHDPNERGRLRLRHGRVTIEHEGRLKNVRISLSSDAADSDAHQQEENRRFSWTRQMDSYLLHSYAKFNANFEMTVEDFVSNFSMETKVNSMETGERLSSLISLAQKLTGNNTSADSP